MLSRLLRRPSPPRIWIDIGAHQGENTLPCALKDPNLRVYAFEPNLRLAVPLASRAPNYIVMPMAVGECNGSQEFHLAEPAACSSLLPFEPEGLSRWVGGDQIEVLGTIAVPVIRLDTFLNLAGIETVDYLKIDAQGADLAVVRSAGERLKDIRRISLEVQVTPFDLYAGGSHRKETIDYLASAGLPLVSAQPQSSGQEEELTFERV